jgi:hypothetical protein
VLSAFTQTISGIDIPTTDLGLPDLNGEHLTFCPKFFALQTLADVTKGKRQECETMFAFELQKGFESTQPGTLIHELAHAVLLCPGSMS